MVKQKTWRRTVLLRGVVEDDMRDSKRSNRNTSAGVTEAVGLWFPNLVAELL